MTVEIRPYKAILSKEQCDSFSDGHVRILHDFGITNVTSNNEEWKSDPHVYFLLATDITAGEAVAGVRIHVFDGKNYPPVCDAVEEFSSSIYTEFDDHKIEGCAEICGLWAGKRVLGRGLGTIMTRAGLAFASQLSIKALYCITAKFNMHMVEALGFRIMTEYGDGGIFPYPTDAYQASVLKIPDIHHIETATPEMLDRILSIRENPNQAYTEVINHKPIDIQYLLHHKQGF